MSETTAKRDELQAESDKLSTKIAQDKAASAKLKEEVATLQKDFQFGSKVTAEYLNVFIVTTTSGYCLYAAVGV